ncbi:hypothetical protein PEL8287_00982 [Roseovarius litorisediminis]|uniref:Uncharacterized protein n=1 Tax=Roseovarius litorisediminis TaxID=1312363 RepID=A0A1Y5RR73_9RHOB|nr:hypothetical protein [Roseovarius litorisediminis]SLN22466.1 hypothetical protein PEL8287_00982 [Roseovarius litorisediminis]
MHNEWILDVLADLKAFARKNGMNVLAEQLDDTRLLAATELALTGEGLSRDETGAATAVGHDFGGSGRRL